MQVQLDTESANIVQTLMSSGNYDSPEGIIKKAMLKMQQKALEFAELKAKIQEGIADLEAGRVRPANEVFEDLEKRHVASYGS